MSAYLVKLNEYSKLYALKERTDQENERMARLWRQLRGQKSPDRPVSAKVYRD